jgi:hypothetical protein
MTRLALLLCLLCGACNLDPFFFGSRPHPGPYTELSDRIVPKDAYDPEGAFVTSADGTRIHTLFVRESGADPERARTAIFYCHGNGGNLGTHFLRVEAFHQLGYKVLAFDPRGSGRSEGSPTEPGYYEDAEAAFAALRARPGVDPGDIVLYGHSLGAAVCTELAMRLSARGTPVRALLLEAPFRSVQDLIVDSAGASIPTKNLSTLSFDNYAKVDKVNAPVFVLHGTEDDYLQSTYGVALFERAREPKELWLVDGADHVNIPGEPGTAAWQRYGERVTRFIQASRKR